MIENMLIQDTRTVTNNRGYVMNACVTRLVGIIQDTLGKKPRSPRVIMH